jgi:tetratricopeptide (TPR) repeat protein
MRGALPGSLSVPTSLTGVIERYIRQLAAGDRSLLDAASVCGVDFRLATVAHVLERDVASAAQACAELARQQRWLNETEDGYAFRHALYREVLYKHIAPVARIELHRKVATALELDRAMGRTVSAAELASHFELAREPIPALRYYAEAAEAALGQLVAEDCVRITEHARPLFEQTPPGRERDTLEITINTLRGMAATRALGAGAEAKSALARAYSLLDRVPEHPMGGRLLHGYGYMLCLRGEYAEALAVADRAERAGHASNDPVLLSTACTLRGQVYQLQGRPANARTWLERGLGLAQKLEVAAGEYLVDPQAALLGSLAIPLVHLGLIDEARDCVQRADTRARERGFPMARLVALWHGALLEVRLGNTERVAHFADEMRALVDEFALAHGQAACRWFRAWADARIGKPRDAYRAIREAYEENARLGMLAGASEVLGYATEALVLARDFDAARTQLREALAYAEKLGERVYLTQLHLLDARISDALGERDRARDAIGKAIAEAKSQEAPWLEALARSSITG